MHDRPPYFPYDGEDDDDAPAWQAALNRLHQAQRRPEPDEDRAPRYRPDRGELVYPCPSCGSFRSERRHVARRICSAVGAAAGATSAMAASLSGAETGAAIGLLGGPLGAVCGSIAGAVLAGLVAAAAGCAAGSAVGAAIDGNILDSHLCLECKRTFMVRPD